MASKYELSKTYQYRKVMKPLLERKRRARINKCLDDLKDLMAECLQQQSGDPNVKLEKVDILELTVQHLRKLKTQRSSNGNGSAAEKTSFRDGYIQAANEVSRCLAAQPNVDVQLGTTLMTHLGLRLNQLEAVGEAKIAINSPLSINCCSSSMSTRQQQQQQAAMYSPVSSGYASDSESTYTTSSRSSSSSSSSTSSSGGSQLNSPVHNNIKSHGLLQVAAVAPVWRPW